MCAGKIDDQIQRYIGLKTAISVVVGVLVYVVLGMVLDVKLAHLFGILTFFLNFIPNVGPVIATGKGVRGTMGLERRFSLYRMLHRPPLPPPPRFPLLQLRTPPPPSCSSLHFAVFLQKDGDPCPAVVILLVSRRFSCVHPRAVLPIPIVVLDMTLSSTSKILAIALPTGIHALIGNVLEPKVGGPCEDVQRRVPLHPTPHSLPAAVCC